MSALPVETAAPTETERPAGMSVFDDLTSAPWAAEAIEYLFSKDIVDGYGNGIYGVNDDVTREQFVKILISALKLDLYDDAEVSFKDVDQNAWYMTYIKSAVKLGIVNGISDNEFGVGQPISRQDMVVMANRALELINKDKTQTESVEDANDVTEDDENASKSDEIKNNLTFGDSQKISDDNQRYFAGI